MRATAVTFHGLPAVYNVVSSTQIQTVVPAAASTGTLTVTTPGGTATSLSQFVVNGTPAPSSGSPATSPLILELSGSEKLHGVPHKTTESVAAHFRTNQPVPLVLSVTRFGHKQKVELLKGTRLVDTRLTKAQLRIRSDLQQAGRYSLRLILPRRRLKNGKTYLIHLSGRAGTSSTLDIRFRA